VENREATKGEISRRSFLKLCVAGISTTALLFPAGCLGGGTMTTTTMTMTMMMTTGVGAAGSAAGSVSAAAP